MTLWSRDYVSCNVPRSSGDAGKYQVSNPGEETIALLSVNGVRSAGGDYRKRRGMR